MPEGHSIERIDNSKGYNKENRCWIPKKLQARNRRSNKRITLEGVTRILVEWLEVKGLSREVYYARLRIGWSVAQAILTPLKHKRFSSV